MEIVIAHSHLNPGGVTRIIESQVESLSDCTVKVIVGSCSKPQKMEEKGAILFEIPSLEYLENKLYADREAMILLHKIHASIKKHLTFNSVLHFHNLNLGKNPIVTYAVYLLAKEGYRIFSHAHDFAEDRPKNYKFLKEVITDNFGQRINEVLYPNLPNYHFGVLNSFDFNRLISYGVKKEKIEWLPNPVTFKTVLDITDKKGAKKQICTELKIEADKKLITYPVRVIQRKNIGEFILLAVLFEASCNFVVTQAPQNPDEIERYKKWVDFCRQNKINICFEAGQKVNFEKLLLASDFCITTSYKEGFGMVYLEPWLLNTPVVGRDIDFITKDFLSDGFVFPALYNRLNITGISSDFKDLSINKQMQVILDVKTNRLKQTALFEQNKVLQTLFDKVNNSIVEKNSSIVKNNYSLEEYGIKLQKRYKKMVG